jgi:opacity protein-like surface antigen
MRQFLSILSLVAVASVASAADVTIPSTGIDMGGYISASILTLGGIVAVAIGGYFAFWAIKKGLSWANKAG